MPKIIPIKDLKNTNAISELCHSVSEPVFITKNGYDDLAIMSMDTFETLFKRLELYGELAISESQFDKGEAVNAYQSLSAIGEKYGL